MKKQDLCLNSKLDEISEEMKPIFPDSRHSSIGNGKLQNAFEANWNIIELGRISTAVGGFAFKSKDFNDDGKYQIIRIGNIQPGNLRLDKSPVFIDAAETKIIEKYLLKQGDVVITLTGTRKKRDYGFTALINKENLLLNQRVAFLRFNYKCLPKFFLYYSWTESFKNQFFASETGNVGQGNVGMKAIESTTIPLPSIEEQRAIVSKIEQLFSELDNGISNLKLAQEQLKVYRQAVLKKAFEGELTVQWRNLNSVLYEWGSKQLNEIAKFIDYRGKTPQKTDYGIPLITAKNVRMGFINEEPREFIAESDYDKWMTRGIPKKGDILFTTEAPLGYVAQLNTNEKIALAQRLITFQPINIVTREYLKYYLMSPKFQTKLHLNSTGTTVKGIKAATLKKLSIDIPSIEEQQAIVQEIETRLSVCDKIEQDIETNLEKAEALRQSILKKAFEGKLLNEKELAEVRGAEDWEPAEVLLERIKAEKTGNGKKGKQETEKLKSIIQEDKGLIQQATLQAFEQIDK